MVEEILQVMLFAERSATGIRRSTSAKFERFLCVPAPCETLIDIIILIIIIIIELCKVQFVCVMSARKSKKVPTERIALLGDELFEAKISFFVPLAEAPKIKQFHH